VVIDVVSVAVCVSSPVVLRSASSPCSDSSICCPIDRSAKHVLKTEIRALRSLKCLIIDNNMIEGFYARNEE
jgi:hypothetical protein